MTPQSHHHGPFHRRKEIERRQVVRPTTTARVTPVRPTATPVRPPIKTPIRTPTVRPTGTPTLTPVRPTATLPSAPPTVSTRVPVPIPSKPATSVVPVVPSSSITSTSPRVSTTSNAIISTTAHPPSSSTTSTSATSSASAAPSSSPEAPSGVSTGAVVGGIVGGFVALGLIGAALFLFLRRVREKKRAHAEAFDAAKFRQSAIQLEDPAEKRRKPRPPTMIEQHVQNTPSSQSNQYSFSSTSQYSSPGASRYREQAHYGAPYGGHTPYNAPYPASYPASYPDAYGTQAPYSQYPPPHHTYGYGDPHAYPPQPHYAPQPHYQHYGAYLPSGPPSVQRPDSLASGQDSLALPNPFASSPSLISERAGPTRYPSNASPTSTTRDVPQSTSVNLNQTPTEDSDAPPAYEATSSFANYKPDLKVKPSTTASNASGESSNVSASTSGSSTPAVTLSAPSSTSSTAAAASSAVTSSTPATADKATPPRPLSSTSALTTVYDLRDAYGGM